jgi:hypothetical protein
MGECAHCNKRRIRNVTVLLSNEDTAELRAIGKSCLTAYTGGKIRAEILGDLTSLGERFATACGGVLESFDDTAPVVDVVALAMRYIALEGYISRASAGPRDTPTGDRVRIAIGYSKGPRPAVTVADLTDADRAAAAETIALVAALPVDGEFMANLHAVIAHDWCQWNGRRSKIGVLAALPYAAHRAREKAARDDARAKRDAGRVAAHIGAEKERRDFTGVVTRVQDFETVHGWSTMVLIDTAEGTVKIFGKVDLDTDAVGSTVTVTGTIAEHAHYNGHPQTRITRVKVLATTPAA